MNPNDEGNEPPPIDEKEALDEYTELEDWDLPAVITEEDECPEILVDVEPEEAFEALFTNIHLSTIISLILGILVGVLFYLLYHYLDIENNPVHQIIVLVIGFCGGVLLVFGSSEIIILGVKGIQDKLNWSPYLSGILQAIGAALAELVVVIFLLVKARQLALDGTEEAIIHANNIATTAITLILTTVIINIFFLGLSMMIVSREEPFALPKELTMFEANLVLGMMVFSFVIMLYGFYFKFTDQEADLIGTSSFNRGFEIIIGLALILVYFIFLFFLIQRFGKRTSTPQTLISEFFPDEDDVIIEEPSTTKFIQSRLFQNSHEPKKEKNVVACEQDSNTKRRRRRKEFDNGSKFNLEKETALATLRRFPWYIIIILFIFGAGGIVWGGQLLSKSIEEGINVFAEAPILVYSVVVGLISSSPELVVTFRGVFKKDKEYQEVGLVHQVSAINQTFFILFGVPFVLSGILNIGIPIALEITIVMGGIFIMSAAEIMMIMDDGKFDWLEGAVITILAIVSLLALTLIGGFTAEGESTHLAMQLAKIEQIL